MERKQCEHERCCGQGAQATAQAWQSFDTIYPLICLMYSFIKCLVKHNNKINNNNNKIIDNNKKIK